MHSSASFVIRGTDNWRYSTETEWLLNERVHVVESGRELDGVDRLGSLQAWCGVGLLKIKARSIGEGFFFSPRSGQ